MDTDNLDPDLVEAAKVLCDIWIDSLLEFDWKVEE
jgi:hypothetical protein